MKQRKSKVGRVLSCVLTLIMVFSMIVTPLKPNFAAAGSIVEEDSYYVIQSIHSEKVLAVQEGCVHNGALIQQRSQKDDLFTQEWNFVEVEEGYYKIVNHSTGKVLSIRDAGNYNGCLVQQWIYTGHDSQLWYLETNDNGTYQIKSKMNDKCLDVAGISKREFACIQVWDDVNGKNQSWTLQKASKVEDYKTTTIISKRNQKVMEVPAGNLYSGAIIQQWDYDETALCQLWGIVPVDKSYYQIVNRSTGGVIEIRDGCRQNGSLVQQADFDGSDKQLWYIESCDDGSYQIKSKLNDKCLDIEGISNCNGAKIQIWDDVDSDNQKWIFDFEQSIPVIDETTITVLDDMEGAKVPGATVTLSSLSKEFCVFSDTGEDGEAVFEDLEEDTYLVTVQKDGYKEFQKEVVFTQDDHIYTVNLEQPYDSAISGRVCIADNDTDYTNNDPLADATITLKKLNSSVELVRVETTDETGFYEFDQLPAGSYKITVEKEGYMAVEQVLEIEVGVKNFYNMLLEAIKIVDEGEGYAGGMIQDALNAKGVEGLTLNIYKNIDTVELIDTVKTDANGIYSTNSLAAGLYSVTIIDTREGIEDSERYLSNTFTIKVLGGKTIDNQNATVSKHLSGDQIRIVVTWNSKSDLDAHLFVQTKSGATAHINYFCPSFLENDLTVASLDVDNATGYGPETITISGNAEGIFTYYVNDYSGRNDSYSEDLTNSGAVVQVYDGNTDEPIYTYYVPTGVGSNWKVFSYDSSTGIFTPYQTVSNLY